MYCLIPPSCKAARPVLPISYQSKQNQADSGTTKIKVNPTQLSEQMPLPVFLSLLPKSDIAAAGTARGGHGESGVVVVVAAVVDGEDGGGSSLQ